jgi:DhnA family fructose-bisphosphate aldolase class Ia
MAGGKKLPEAEALQMFYNAIQKGTAGGRYGGEYFSVSDASGNDSGSSRN